MLWNWKAILWMIRGSVALSFRQLKSILLIPSLPPRLSHCFLLLSLSLSVCLFFYSKSPFFCTLYKTYSCVFSLPVNLSVFMWHTLTLSDTKTHSELLICMSSFHVCSLNTAVCVISRSDCSSWQAVMALMCLICCYASKADEQDAEAAADTTSHIKDFPRKLFELWNVWHF